jgi:hypothetical protein
VKSRDNSKPQARAVSRADSLPSPSRRRLLKGGATALPAILTLHSGAALARSSNLLSASASYEVDSMGRTLCVDITSVVPVEDYSQIYDLGDPPHAVINVIRGEAEGRIYYVNKDDKDLGNSIHPGLMCEQGGQYWYKPSSGPWEIVDVPQGFVASSIAASSFAMDMTENLI